MAALREDTELRRRVADLVRADPRTQKDLAAAAGVSQQTLSAILTGQRADLRADVVARIARACGLSPTALGRLLYESIPAPGSGGEKIPDCG